MVDLLGNVYYIWTPVMLLLFIYAHPTFARLLYKIVWRVAMWCFDGHN
jgi:hypothetical protein